MAKSVLSFIRQLLLSRVSLLFYIYIYIYCFTLDQLLVNHWIRTHLWITWVMGRRLFYFSFGLRLFSLSATVVRSTCAFRYIIVKLYRRTMLMEFSNFIWYYITYNVVMRRNSLFKIDTTRDYDILIITRTIFFLGGGFDLTRTFTVPLRHTQITCAVIFFHAACQHWERLGTIYRCGNGTIKTVRHTTVRNTRHPSTNRIIALDFRNSQ